MLLVGQLPVAWKFVGANAVAVLKALPVLVTGALKLAKVLATGLSTAPAHQLASVATAAMKRMPWRGNNFVHTARLLADDAAVPRTRRGRFATKRLAFCTAYCLS